MAHLLQVPDPDIALPVSRDHPVAFPIGDQTGDFGRALFHRLQTFARLDVPQLDAAIDRSRHQQNPVERRGARDGVALQGAQVSLRLQTPYADLSR